MPNNLLRLQVLQVYTFQHPLSRCKLSESAEFHVTPCLLGFVLDATPMSMECYKHIILYRVNWLRAATNLLYEEEIGRLRCYTTYTVIADHVVFMQCMKAD